MTAVTDEEMQASLARKRIMDGDPGVQAGIFTCETHAVRSFPGFSLPDKPA